MLIFKQYILFVLWRDLINTLRLLVCDFLNYEGRLLEGSLARVSHPPMAVLHRLIYANADLTRSGQRDKKTAQRELDLSAFTVGRA
jgi:hypothetical protein